MIRLPGIPITIPVHRFISVSVVSVIGIIVAGADGTGGIAGITIMDGIHGVILRRNTITTTITAGADTRTITGMGIMAITRMLIITTTIIQVVRCR
jgi:hypothetical protein